MDFPKDVEVKNAEDSVKEKPNLAQNRKNDVTFLLRWLMKKALNQ